MRDTIAILLDVDRVRVLSQSAPGAVVAEVAWNPRAPDDAVAALRAKVPSSPVAVLVVGLGLLELAQPELPPLAPDMRRAMLLRDADRYFPVTGPVGVSWSNGFACAVDAAGLDAWMRAFGAIANIKAAATVMDCLARANADGTWVLSSSTGETGWVTIRNGTVADVRRRAAPADRTGVGQEEPTANTTGAPRPSNASASTPRPLDLGAVARGAASLVDAPFESMLLHDALHRQFASARRQRWLSSAAALLLGATTLAWAADVRRDRQLRAVNSQIDSLTIAAEPAQRAAERLQRARAESQSVAAPRVDPGIVLERLGALLPRDAFIQRLEWDGLVWRIDGSALDAPRIVPLLDASPAFDDVRIVAASTRFLDAGQQRESFSISFRVRGADNGGQ